MEMNKMVKPIKKYILKYECIICEQTYYAKENAECCYDEHEEM